MNIIAQFLPSVLWYY